MSFTRTFSPLALASVGVALLTAERPGRHS